LIRLELNPHHADVVRQTKTLLMKQKQKETIQCSFFKLVKLALVVGQQQSFQV
jgi:hypothetical protein